MMKPLSEVPRPKGSSLSHTLRFAKNTMQFYEDAYRECGDLFATRIAGLGNWVYVCSPALIREMLDPPSGVLGAGEVLGFNLSQVLGKGAISHLDGAAHAERRSIAAPYFHPQASLRSVEETERITARRIAEWPQGTPFPAVLPLQKIALEALLRVFFPAVAAETLRELADLYETLSFKGLRSATVSHPSLQFDFPGSPWRRVQARQKALVERYTKEIAARLQAVDRPEADDLLLGMARARLSGGGRISPEVILAEILDFLFQGHELTGNALTWTLAELLLNPEPLARLRQELEGVGAEGGERSSRLTELPYLDAVVQEGIRKRPVNLATTVRRVMQPFALGGYELPEGTIVAICYPALAVRDDLFANPKSFDPDHFLDNRPSEEAWSPFGVGAHACLGKHLALVIVKSALATIVRQTDLKLAQDEVKVVRNAYFYEPNQGLLVRLEGRR
jgi:cytochrome P450